VSGVGYSEATGRILQAGASAIEKIIGDVEGKREDEVSLFWG
jgi:hypothetical protein